MPFGVWSMIAKRSSLVMALLLALPQAALALGLGTIHVKSHLDQPLDARIDLLDATPGAVQSLSVGLASQATFAKYGLNWPSYLNGVQVRVVRGPGGSVQLHVTSPLPVTDPILTLLVKASWDRGVLFREYTILVNPPVYVPGSSQPHHVAVAAPVVGNAPRTGELPGAPAASAPTAAAATLPVSSSGGPRTLRVHAGQTLSGIASRFSGGGMDSGPTRQWMVAIYQRNPQAFASNMNLLRAGAVLHIPSASAAAQVSPNAAWQQVLSQDNAWRAAQGQGSSRSGHLRLVAPQAPGAGASAGASAAPGTSAQVSALQSQVQTLQKELQQEKRLVEVKSAALAALQSQAAAGAAAAHTGTATAPAAAPGAPAHTVQAHRPASAAVPRPAAPGALGQMVHRYWWALLALLALIGAYLAAKVLRSRGESAADERLIESAEPGFAAPAARVMPVTPSGAAPHADDAIDVREATHEQPRLEMNEAGSARVAPHVPADQTMSSETALNLEQGDPLAEADFHMAYGLYDQAADLVRIALEREPDRRDLRLKLLEIYFVWGNKDLFLQTAKSLYETRDRAPVGEWDKIVIMGKQICPEEPLFAHATGAGRGAGAPVDLNLEGGENRVDVDLFGEPPGEHSPHEPPAAKDADDTAATGESPQLHGDSGLDFVLDAPERGADESPTREMPQRDEPTVESEIMSFAEPNVAESPTTESPALAPAAADGSPAAKAKAMTTDQTAEVSIDDLGLDLEGLERTGTPDSGSAAHLEPTDHPANAATMVAGLDERSRRMMADAENRTRDRELTELERELEASFIADLDSSHTEIKTAVLPADAVPTMQIPQVLRDAEDAGATSRVPSFKEPEAAESAARPDPDSTSRLQSVGDGLDLDLDRLAGALGGDTVEQPRAAEDVFSSEVFEASRSAHSAIDLDVGAPLHEDAGNGATTLRPDEATMPPMDGAAPTEFEPVTMSEVGTKLDLARAYMDMGDPEGARSILDEVVQEGSASQKQEAERLLQSLPG